MTTQPQIRYSGYGIDMKTMRITGPDLKLAEPTQVMAMCNAYDELVTALRNVVNATACLIAESRTAAEQECLNIARTALAKLP